MKKIKTILSILFGMLSLTLFSQQQGFLFTPGSNNLNTNIDKFVGTWKWEGNGKSLTIILKKENILYPNFDNIRGDVLIGFHKYTDNGSIIEDSTTFSSTNFSENKYSIFVIGDENTNFIDLGIRHTSKNKSIDGKLTYMDASHVKLEDLENVQGIKLRLPGQPPFDPSISLPQNIVLTKQ